MAKPAGTGCRTGDFRTRRCLCARGLHGCRGGGRTTHGGRPEAHRERLPQPHRPSPSASAVPPAPPRRGRRDGRAPPRHPTPTRLPPLAARAAPAHSPGRTARSGPRLPPERPAHHTQRGPHLSDGIPALLRRNGRCRLRVQDAFQPWDQAFEPLLDFADAGADQRHGRRFARSGFGFWAGALGGISALAVGIGSGLGAALTRIPWRQGRPPRRPACAALVALVRGNPAAQAQDC